MKYVIVITGASSGFGLMSARALAHAGHTVYAGMRETHGRNAARVEELKQYAKEHGEDLRAVEMDVASQASVDAAIAQIIGEQQRLDVVIHNAGHMSYGPAEAFTPEQFAQLYDTNVLSTQRVNRAALPQLRSRVADWWCGSPPAVSAAARRPIWRRISRRRRAWIRWR